MSLRGCLEIVAQLRLSGVSQPLLLMGYYNPILSYGVGRFVAEAAQAGADGLIIPDLPPEEAGELEIHCRASQLALVFLAAPTSTPERLALVALMPPAFSTWCPSRCYWCGATRFPPGWKSLLLACARLLRCPWRSGLGSHPRAGQPGRSPG